MQQFACWVVVIENRTIFPDSLLLRLNSKGIDFYDTIDVKPFKRLATQKSYYEEADIFVMEYKSGEKFAVKTINNLVHTPPRGDIEKAVLYGFYLSKENQKAGKLKGLEPTFMREN